MQFPTSENPNTRKQSLSSTVFAGTEMRRVRSKNESSIVKEDYSKGQGRENYSERDPDGKLLLVLAVQACNDPCSC